METKNSCGHPDCFAPQIACHKGESRYRECTNWQGSGDSNVEEKGSSSDDSGLLPWSGISFGTVDLQQIAARGQPSLVGLVGLHNAGKTTMLTLLYLLLCRGISIPKRKFAGSYTLGGWEQRAYYLRLPPGGIGAGFPPHTSLNLEERESALLHLAFRHVDGSLQDVLLSDAPGEWFNRWAINRGDPSAEGARWLSRKATGFLLLLDSEALAGEERGRKRSRHISLIQRVSSEAGNRPVAVVWSKADVAVPEEIRLDIRETFSESIENFEEFAVSIEETCQHPELTLSDITNILGWVLDKKPALERGIPALQAPDTADPFIAYRGA